MAGIITNIYIITNIMESLPIAVVDYMTAYLQPVEILALSFTCREYRILNDIVTKRMLCNLDAILLKHNFPSLKILRLNPLPRDVKLQGAVVTGCLYGLDWNDVTFYFNQTDPDYQIDILTDNPEQCILFFDKSLFSVADDNRYVYGTDDVTLIVTVNEYSDDEDKGVPDNITISTKGVYLHTPELMFTRRMELDTDDLEMLQHLCDRVIQAYPNILTTRGYNTFSKQTSLKGRAMRAILMPFEKGNHNWDIYHAFMDKLYIHAKYYTNYRDQGFTMNVPEHTERIAYLIVELYKKINYF